MPWKNRFITRNFDIVSEASSDFDYPLMIFKNETCKCFFKSDKKFNLPHGFINIHFKSNLVEKSTQNINMTAVYSMCVKKFLSEKLFSAIVVGYVYKLYAVEDGMILKLSGLSEKLPLLVKTITRAMQNVDNVIDYFSFEIYRKELKKNCYSFIINSNQFIE